MKQIDFAERLTQALDSRGSSAADLSRATGASDGTISCYKKGKYQAKQNRAYDFARVLRVDLAWLMGYDVPMEPQGQSAPAKPTIPPGFLPMPKTIKRPLVGRIACGEPITAEQNIEKYVDVPEDVRCNFCLECDGDSMIDVGIHSGDVVYIRIQPEVENGEIAAVLIGEEATLKKVYYDGESLILMPCNASYLPKTYSGPALDEIKIESKAVGFTHWFRK